MSGLTRRPRRTLIGERRLRGKVLWQQRFSLGPATASGSAATPSAGATPERIRQIRRELAAGTYLGNNAEQKLMAVVDGLLSDMTDFRRKSAVQLAPLSAIAV